MSLETSWKFFIIEHASGENMRFLVLIAAVTMQMCLGATYSWSVYVQPLKALTGLQQGPVQVPFTMFYFIFPLSMMIAGRFLPVLGTRKSGVIGGLLFGTGWMFASLGTDNFLFTTLGIGLVSGFGAGMAYIVPITVCVKWFPKNKGLVTGIAVAGFGGGAALVSQIGGLLLSTGNFTPFETFFTFGLCFTILVCLAGLFMVSPHKDDTFARAATLQSKEILNGTLFRILYLAMVIGLAAGFAINANLKELFQGTQGSVRVGVTAVSLFAVANALGRISWGWLFDRMNPTRTIQVNLLFQALSLVCAPFLVTSVIGFWLVSFLVGFNYGGVLVLYVSSVSNLWGVQNVGQIYGMLFTSNIPASLSPILAGMVYDRYHSFNGALFVLAAMLVGAVILVQRLKENLDARTLI